jgi:hypothetical protein
MAAMMQIWVVMTMTRRTQDERLFGPKCSSTGKRWQKRWQPLTLRRIAAVSTEEGDQARMVEAAGTTAEMRDGEREKG